MELNVNTALVLAGLALRAVLALVVGGLLWDLHRRYQRAYVRTWSHAWLSYAGAQVTGVFALLDAARLPPDAPRRVALWVASSACLYASAALVVAGSLELERGRSTPRRARGALLVALLVAGALPTLLTASPATPDRVRAVANLVVRSLVVGLTLLGTAGWLARRRDGLGPRATAVGTALLGVSELAVVAATGLRLLAPEARPGVLPYALPLVGVVAVATLGLGMLVWFLEEERGRVLRLTSERAEVERQRAALVDQLRQAQKMEAVGRLASGVTHDFKNLLTVIGSWLPEVESGRAADRAEGVAAIRSAYDRAIALTQRLLSFARQQPIRAREVDLGGVVREVGALVRQAMPAGARLEVHADGRWPVQADPDLLGQVVMNLALNARDALERGGTVRLSVRRVEHPAPLRAGPDLAPAGAYLAIEVADDGAGMDDAVKARLFEPFFTTKPEGKGTGLGLSTAYGIVRQSGGFVMVESAKGAGATFTVLLPAPAAPADAAAA